MMTEEERIDDQVAKALVGHLKRWGKWVGVASLATLGSSLAYVFFVLPEQAADKALKVYKAEFDIRKLALEPAIAAAADARAEATRLESRIKELEKQTADAEINLQRLLPDKSKVELAGKLLNALEKEDVEELSALVAKLHDAVHTHTTDTAREVATRSVKIVDEANQVRVVLSEEGIEVLAPKAITTKQNGFTPRAVIRFDDFEVRGNMSSVVITAVGARLLRDENHPSGKFVERVLLDPEQLKFTGKQGTSWAYTLRGPRASD